MGGAFQPNIREHLHGFTEIKSVLLRIGKDEILQAIKTMHAHRNRIRPGTTVFSRRFACTDYEPLMPGLELCTVICDEVMPIDQKEWQELVAWTATCGGWFPRRLWVKDKYCKRQIYWRSSSNSPKFKLVTPEQTFLADSLPPSEDTAS